jgi:hypothetical protein
VDNLVNGFFRDAGHGGGLEGQIYTRLGPLGSRWTPKPWLTSSKQPLF